MNSFVFKTDEIRSARGFKSSLKPKPEGFKDLFLTTELLSFSVSVTFSLGDSCILAEGEIKAVLKAECSRCLKTFELKVEDKFEEVYEEPGNEINLEPAVREALAMMEPQKPVCPDGCDETFLKKYAPSQDGAKGPFSALKDLDFGKKEK